MTSIINVDLPRQPYEVHVGRGIVGKVAEIVDLGLHTRVLIVTQPPVARHHLQSLTDGLRAHDHRVEVVEVPDGEGAKSPEILAHLWRKAAEIPLTRRDVIVSLGGGVVCDLAGFLAATWNRGIPVVHVATTVLAQVDAAVGGKTGINLPEGKNLVGAFHQPLAVIADVDTLGTLSERARREGFAEVLKAGFLRDSRVVELLEAGSPAMHGPADDVTVELIERSIAVKAAVVASDEREHGARAYLNFGHTIGHAVETMEGYGSWLHGEAVAVGMVAAARIGLATGQTSPELAARIEAAVAQLGLPTRLPVLDRSELWQVLARDKKADRGVRFVLLEGMGAPTLSTPDRSVVDAVLDELTGPSSE